MRADRSRQVERLYRSALEREEPARDAFLPAACPEDEELRREVPSLLDQPGGGSAEPPFAVGSLSDHWRSRRRRDGHGLPST